MDALILVSRADPASLTIRDALLDLQDWRGVGDHAGLPVRTREGFLMVEVEGLHLTCDGLDRTLRSAGWTFDCVLFASKHRAESGKPALTVHPIGIPGASADFGGKPRTLVPTDPIRMGRVLRSLAAQAKGLAHQTTFEATHHGPNLETASMFVEIGTDETAWRDRGLGKLVARAILAAAEPSPGDAAPILVALGGSHYAPRPTDLAKASRANFGHILPSYALDDLPPEVAFEAVRGTPGCQGYYLDTRTPRLPDDLANVFTGLDMGMWREEDLPPSPPGPPK